jgi:hypothetical protein
MDFNPIDIARDQCLGNDENIVTEATIIPKSTGVFKEDVISSLPFRVIKHRIPSNLVWCYNLRLDDCMVVVSDSDVYSFI